MHRWLIVVATLSLAGAFLTISGCSKGTAPGSAPPVALSDNEVRYGQNPSRSDPSITFEPDVVTIANGADDVHNVSSDGLTWTFDSNAPHASDVAIGKVLFLTSRAVGRVLGVQHQGNDLAVTLGPIAITDLIKDCDLTSDQPVDLTSMNVYTAPNYPQSLASTIAPSSAQVVSVQALRLDALGNAFAMPALADVVQPPKEIDIHDFHVTPFCCGGIGIKVEYNKNGTIVKALAVIRLNAPSVHFDLKIADGTVQVAQLELRGVGGLRVEFVGGSQMGVHANVHTPPIMVPVELSLPINLHPPFAMAIHQSFLLKTAFTSKNSTSTATGDYSFTGSFKMGYDHGAWGVSAPTSFTTNQNLLDSISGLAIGPEALLITYQMKIIVGVGAFGFATGPYLGYTTSVGIVQQGAVGMPCNGADLGIGMNAGIGYSIPQPITKAINFVLRQLNFQPISSAGGLISKFTPVISKHESFPQNCAGM
jgi:hypothetical protein